MPLDPAKIRSRREKLGLTQPQAARLAGLTTWQHWQKLELGRTPNPRADTLAAVARVLGCRAEDLLTGGGAKN